jgi:hypothetical protein
MTDKSSPSGGVAVAGSSCSHVSGKTIMTFQHPLKGDGPSSTDITPGTSQVVIYAHGQDGKTIWQKHDNDSRGGKNLDFKTMTVSEAEKKTGGAALFFHLIFMSLAWACLLPWGVAIANRTRNIPGAPKGAWLTLHRRFQSVGWLVQLIGFVMAIWHCADKGVHFDNGHTWIGLIVTVLATLQPINAFLRPHLPGAGEIKSMGRQAFEVIHKGGGYLCLVLALVNLIYGVFLLFDQEYNMGTILTPIICICLGLVPVIAYTVLACINPNFCVSRLCVGARAGGDVEEPASDPGKFTC